MNNHLKILAIMVAVLATASTGALLFFNRDTVPGGTAAQATTRIGGPFSLKGPGGKIVTDLDFLGHPFAIFFGYTHCPDVCPTTLAEIDAAREDIGAEAEKLHVIFVSVDPDRDTPDELQSYLASFRHPVVGLTGTPEEIDAVAQGYRVFFGKVPGEDGDYTMDHTAAVYLMDAQGNFVDTLGYGEDHDSLVQKLRDLLARPTS